MYDFYGQEDGLVDTLFQGEHASGPRRAQFREGPVEVLTGIFSNDYDFLTFKHRLSLELTKKFPESVDEWGRVSGNGVRSNFYGIRHVSGYPMRPATWPIADNTKLRKDAGLASGWVEDWHKRVFQAIVRLFFSDLSPMAMKLRKSSSSCAPFFEKDLTKKESYARESLANAEKAGNLMLEGNYEDAWLKHRIGGAYFVVYREQASDSLKREGDKWIPKERPVADVDYALSGGESGNLSPAIKSLDNVEFRTIDGFFRTRKRTAMGGPLGINSTLMAIAQPVREHIYSEYAYTFHHTTRTAIQDDLRDWEHVIAADVTQHDQFWPPFLLETIADELDAMGFAPWWVEIYRTKGKLPLYVTGVDVGQENGLIGDWRKPDLKCGLPSGNAFTDIEGTILMTGVYFIMMVEHTLPHLRESFGNLGDAMDTMDAFMKGKLPIRLKDKSDDALLGWSDRTLIPRATKLHEAMKAGEQISPYMKVSYEHGFAFLGNLLLYPKDMNPRNMTLTGNIISYVVNQFSPEYGVETHKKDRSKAKRPFPGLAWGTYDEAYGSSPIYGEVKETIERVWYDVFGASYSRWRDKMYEADLRNVDRYARQQAELSGLLQLSAIDQEALADPAKMEYKFSKDDVSQAVLDFAFKGLTKDEVEPFFNTVYPR